MSPIVSPDRLDHVHLYVHDRPAALRWYHAILGFRPYGKGREETPPDDHPVFLATAGGAHVISLFVGDRPRGGDRTVAFHAGAAAFLGFASALPHEEILGWDGTPVTVAGHHDYGMAITFNFQDPAGNHLELVTYDVEETRKGLEAVI